VSDHDVTLLGLVREAERQAALLDGREWNQAVSTQALNVAASYAKRVKERWQIELTAGVAFSFNTGKLEISITPASDLDKLMWEALIAREGLTV